MPKRQNIASGAQLEKAYGYSRAVKAGDTLYIAGTIGKDHAAGELPQDAVGQLRQIIRNWEPALAAAGGSLKDIVQVTTYVSAPDVLDEVGPELGVIFKDVLPTNVFRVVAFAVPGVRVELSAVAVIGCDLVIAEGIQS